MSLETVSAVITFFDSERYLTEAIDSVLAQTHPPTELLLVDDGSTDGSAVIARSYGAPARYIHRENGGPAAARNTALSHAGCDLLAFLDSDNRWLPGATAARLAAFDADPGLDVVFAQAREFVSPELDASVLTARPARSGTTGALISSMLARRSAFSTVGPFDERLRVGEWVDWFSRLQHSACRTTVIPEVVVERRIHTSNNSAVHWDDGREYTKALKAALDRRRRGR
ncbi:MAG TPA: glycosyltransferase family A protein [Acidimicrobiia bacterium]|nr:glycosyltransferase family A protein [Acidimicrobiia bacterium]